jgi:hypothetical protein
MAMIRRAEMGNHGVKYLLAYDASRFGRLTASQETYWEERLRRAGIEMLYLDEEFRPNRSGHDELGRFSRHREAHQFSRKLSKDVLRGCLSHSRLGTSCGGRAPFGYDRLLLDHSGKPVKVLTKGHHKNEKLERVIWTVNPEQSKIVLSLFERYNQGIGIHRLAEDLNCREIPSPTGSLWGKHQISYILKNRVYLGERIYNKRGFKAYQRRERVALYNPKEQWIIAKNAHEAIVAPELFNSVQAKLPHWKTHRASVTKRRYLLTGLAVCNDCGYRLTGMKKSGKGGHEYFYYTCAGNLQTGTCRSVNVPEAELEKLALTAIKNMIRSQGWRAHLRSAIKARITGQFDGDKVRERIADLQVELRKAEHQLKNIVEAIKATGFIPSLEAELPALETRKADLIRQIAEEKTRLDAAPDADRLADDILAEVERFDEIWAKVRTNEEKKTLLRDFVFQIGISRGDKSLKAAFTLYNIPPSKNVAGITPTGDSGHELQHLPVPKVAGARLGPYL